MEPTKYIAIKIKGMNHYLWFERAKTEIEDNSFIGRDGWGEGGAFTHINVSEDEIIGRIESESLQYN